MDASFVARINTIEGDKPVVAKMPEDDGIYWVREVSARIAYWIDEARNRYDAPGGRRVWAINTWEGVRESDWFLVQIANGNVDTFGSDEGFEWETRWRHVTTVGPRVSAPLQ